MSEFSLYVDGKRYGGWMTIRVTRGLERCAADFALSVSERWAGQDTAWQILPGLACKVYIDSDLVLTGWVDAFRPNVSAEEHVVEVTGRSITCDFVDSSVTIEGGQLKGLTVRQIAELLAQPFGIKVIAKVEGDPVPEVQIQQCETCFQVVERLARLQELLITDDVDGNLVLTRAGDDRSTTELVQGVNMMLANADLDDSDRFSDYIVKAQRAGNKTNDDRWSGLVTGGDSSAHQLSGAARAAWRAGRLSLLQQGPHRDAIGFADDGEDTGDDGEDADDDAATDTETDRSASVINEIEGTAKDPGVTRYRPKVIIAEAESDDSTAANRADWEMRRRAAKATKATITLTGWRQRDGSLWVPNLMVNTRSPYLAVDRDLIISEVEFTYGETGEQTKLTLTLPDAFLPKKIRKSKHKGKGKGGGGGDRWSGLVT
jgi:prophage tail gpP-like protein